MHFQYQSKTCTGFAAKYKKQPMPPTPQKTTTKQQQQQTKNNQKKPGSYQSYCHKAVEFQMFEVSVAKVK